MKRRAIESLSVPFLGIALVLGCACFTQKKPVQARPTLPRVEEPDPTHAQREDEIRALKADREEKKQRLSEQDALIQELNDLLELRQRQLEEAIQEVVRAKAAQRSVESQAEAAAQMAETEIALDTFRTQLGGRHSSELAQAEQLLARSNREFEVLNFGGALYLAFQAKAQIAEGTRRLEVQVKLGGEAPFASPLAFTLKKRSNLRQGPGLEFDVIHVLDPGATVTGYTSKGSWVHVRRDDGTDGWIHQTLLDAG